MKKQGTQIAELDEVIQRLKQNHEQLVADVVRQFRQQYDAELAEANLQLQVATDGHTREARRTRHYRERDLATLQGEGALREMRVLKNLHNPSRPQTKPSIKRDRTPSKGCRGSKQQKPSSLRSRGA